MKKANTEWSIRSAQPSDIPFIYDTWLKCYKHGSALGKSCRSKVFFDNYKTILDQLLAKSTTLVACRINDPEVIYGYMVTEPKIIHFCFVKEAFRNFGIASSLLYDAFPDPVPYPLTCTHKTFEAELILESYLTHFHFNPFLLYRKDS